MKLKFSSPALPKSGPLVVTVETGGSLKGIGAQADHASNGHLKKAMKAAKFDGKKDQLLDIVAPPSLPLERVILAGVGEAQKLTEREMELLGGAICGTLQAAKVKEATVAIDHEAIDPAAVASGLLLRNYAFGHYKSKKENGLLEAVTVMCADPAQARRKGAAAEAVAQGVHLARDLVNEPANVLFPIEFAARARKLSRDGLAVEVLNRAQMQKLGMGALLGVAQGSAHEPRLVVMRWQGGRRGEAPIAFVGKGVTFDTGGISIKPAAGMEDMKGDMGGAACVTGLMLALARRKARVNAIGAIGLVENMPSGTAQRPGDIVKSMSGQTIAVLNTDAEGRLVLADVLWYVQNRFKPKFMIDLATLTGAIMVALGKEHAGLFSNNDELSARLIECGLATGEKVWRMPLAPEYDKLLDYEVADMKNIGGRHAGAITAAQFLQRFVNNVPWAHLDVAGTAMDSGKSAISQSWASGWGVRLLNRLVEQHYEG
jgi:leucyl aminopeptidase